jgi:hypothetical protein
LTPAELLARLPREPHLHVKRTLAVQALELLETRDAHPAAVEVMRSRHAIELPDPPSVTPSDVGQVPARDPFVEIGAGTHPLNDALIEAEVAAATYVETEDPALARLAAERMAATVALEDGWGAEPVDVSRYGELMALPAADRVQQLVGEGGRRDEDPVL